MNYLDKDGVKRNVNQINPYLRFIERLGPYTEKNYFVPSRIIYDYEIIFILDGELEAEFGETKFTLHPQDIHIIPPFVRHRHFIEKNRHCLYYCLHLDFFYDEETADFSAVTEYSRYCKPEIDEVPVNENLRNRHVDSFGSVDFPLKFRVENHRELTNTLDLLYKHSNSDKIADRLLMKGESFTMLAQIIENLPESAGGEENSLNTTVSQFIHNIVAHYNEEIDLSKFAIENGYSPDYFRKLFKKITNKTPNEYLIDFRMDQAKKLLSSGLYSITEIAYMVGYEDVHYFSRLFKRKQGVAPSKLNEKD